MIKEFVQAWDKNKSTLEQYFKTHTQDAYDSYESLVRLLFNIVINPAMVKPFNTENIIELDDGDWQGTQVFILHRNTYQPDICDYVYTNTYYGSCSGCDTLMAISGYGYDIPSEEQVKDYMQLCLTFYRVA